jgi:hypothetical protein
LHELATTHPWAAPPLLGFVCLTEFLIERLCCHAYRVSVIPLCRYPSREPKFEWDRLDSGVSTPPPFPRSFDLGISSLRLWLPYRVSPMHHREVPVIPEGFTVTRPFRGFFPFSVYNHEEPHTPPVPIPPVLLRPQGFSPSRRLAPLMAFRAYSIPVPLMGFLTPFEALILTRCRTLSRAPRPSGFRAKKE